MILDAYAGNENQVDSRIESCEPRDDYLALQVNLCVRFDSIFLLTVGLIHS